MSASIVSRIVSSLMLSVSASRYTVGEVKEFRVSSLSSAVERAQVCHDDRVVELREQLEVEEEDGDRQEEEVEVEREK